MASAVLDRQQKPKEIDYPSRDGKPVAETDTHFSEIVAINQLLQELYSGDPDVYVASNNLFYYTEGDPKDRFSPDVYVVFGIPKRERRVYLLWQEKHVPSVIFEVSSRSTNLEDRQTKMALYQKLGVKEYFLYDPENDYLKPPLQGYRLANGAYEPIKPGAGGQFLSEELSLNLGLNSFMRIEFFDAKTGVRLPRVTEARRRAEERLRAERELLRQAEERARADKELAREADERAALAIEAQKKAETELAQLRAELERLKKS